MWCFILVFVVLLVMSVVEFLVVFVWCMWLSWLSVVCLSEMLVCDEMMFVLVSVVRLDSCFVWDLLKLGECIV